ncbi:MAG: metalloregulator ArsR/SmtB family transcription factor [Corynebacterium sp.]|nr:metalloregulator ArsR/SmtB family transcription factor [Corynebacterium sp.]
MYHRKYVDPNATLHRFGEAYQNQADNLAVEVSEVFRSIADPTRLKILYLIALNDKEVITGARISEELGISAPTVTHHIRILERAGFITRIRDGRRGKYEVNVEQFAQFNLLVRFLCDSYDF